MRFGTSLRNLRLQRKMTQTEFAEALGTSQSSITAWENETRQPDFATVSKICKFFNVPMSSLIETADDMNASFAVSVAESLHLNPKLKLLFDRSRFLSDSDLDAVLAIVNAIQKERKE